MGAFQYQEAFPVTKLKQIDTAIRRWLCGRYGHKFYCGSSGYYPSLPQNQCWRCGRVKDNEQNRRWQLPEYGEPLGRWFN
jgi:hypothetical protein